MYLFKKNYIYNKKLIIKFVYIKYLENEKILSIFRFISFVSILSYY